jgi:hypothetical protein
MNKKRLQELAGIEQPEQPKYVFGNIIDEFIKRDNPEIINDISSKYTDGWHLKDQSDLFYDLGGGEGPVDSPNNIVVDFEDFEGEYEEGKEINKFIAADLDKFKKLPPLSAINVSFSAAYIFPKPLAKTIDHALKPGGILNIADHARAIADVMKNLKNYKLIEIKIPEGNYEENEDDPANTPIGCIFIK